MTWVLIGLIAMLAILSAITVWRKWIAPWTTIERLIRQISLGERPRGFLIHGGSEPIRAGLALEDLFKQQQRLDQQISERTSGTETIISAMQEALIVVDAHRRVRLVNKTFRNLFGLAEEVSETPLLDLVRNVELDRVITETLRTGLPQTAECVVSDGKMSSPRQMQLSAVATRNEQNVITGAVALLHDITQLKQVDEMRRDFVANVSHEIRTPLSIIKGYIETLLSDPDVSPAELARILEVMNRHSNRLGGLVDDLLSLAQLESTDPRLQWSDVRMSELFAAIVRDWGRKIAEKKVSIDVAVDANLPVIRADETRLQEILYNLLDNALKYSHSGSKIHLTARRRDETVVLSVADTGVGISSSDLPRIFERFYRVDKARSRELGGTGLGLSIVKHIAAMHGGSVRAESALGRGTTIHVELPLNGAIEKMPVTES